MTTLGAEWRQRVPPTWDESDPDGRHLYVLAQNQLEEQAETLFAEWREDVVPRRLRECMDRGAQFMGFQTQAWLLNTAAFIRFRQWLAAQELLCNCAYPPDDDADLAAGDNIVLMILPRTAEAVIAPA